MPILSNKADKDTRIFLNIKINLQNGSEGDKKNRVICAIRVQKIKNTNCAKFYLILEVCHSRAGGKQRSAEPIP